MTALLDSEESRRRHRHKTATDVATQDPGRRQDRVAGTPRWCRGASGPAVRGAAGRRHRAVPADRSETGEARTFIPVGAGRSVIWKYSCFPTCSTGASAAQTPDAPRSRRRGRARCPRHVRARVGTKCRWPIRDTGPTPTWALLETMPDAILAVDLNGIIVYANRLIEEMFGYPTHVLIGQPGRGSAPRRGAGQASPALARVRGGAGGSYDGWDRRGSARASPQRPGVPGRHQPQPHRYRGRPAGDRRGPATRPSDGGWNASSGRPNERLRRDFDAAANIQTFPFAGTAGRGGRAGRGLGLRALRPARRGLLQRVHHQRTPGRLLPAGRDRSRRGGGAAVGRSRPRRSPRPGRRR